MRKLLLVVLGSQSDISFDPTFLDNFLNDDDASIRLQSNVNDWTPQSPIQFFHGRDDTTVPYANTESAFQAMTTGAQHLCWNVRIARQNRRRYVCVPTADQWHYETGWNFGAWFITGV